MKDLYGAKPGDLLIEDARGMGSLMIHKVVRVTKLYVITTGRHIDHKWRISDGIQPGAVAGFHYRRAVRKPEPGEIQAIAMQSRFRRVMRDMEEAVEDSKNIKSPTAENLATAAKALALIQSLLDPETAEPSDEVQV